ncbi:MAG: cation:proton antiporter [Pseudomonadota bacterium]
MLITSSVILLIILLARLFEELLKLPFTLSIITLSYAASMLAPDLFVGMATNFDEILYLMLPVILLPDILSLSIKEMRQHIGDFIYLALVAVIASITLAVWITPFILPQYSFSLPMLIALYAMLMATDAITVSSVFSRFNIPERLKIYAEGESLFNDITALIIFYFVALQLLGGSEVLLGELNLAILKVVSLSILIGLCIAFLGFLGLKVIKDPMDQFIILYLVSIISFILAEHWHLAGILSIVSSIMMFKYLLDKENDKLLQKMQNSDYKQMTEDSTNHIQTVINLIKQIPAVSNRGMRAYKKEAYYIGIFANAIVFICIANLVEIDKLFLYHNEILIIFALTTIIRYFFIQSFMFVHKLPLRWGNVLTLGGMKGGLTIIMVHSLPDSFVYKELFEAIIVGIVILSTFLYSFINVLYLHQQQHAFEADKIFLNEKHTVPNITASLKQIIEHDPITNAYNFVVFEDILAKEVSRAQRYKLDLSLLLFKINLNQLNIKQHPEVLRHVGKIILQQMRDNDIYGKLADDTHAVIGVNTSLNGAMIFCQRIKEKFIQQNQQENAQQISFSLSYVELSEGDTATMLVQNGQAELNLNSSRF